MKTVKKIENYDKGMIFVIGYLCYGGYVESLNISKWLKTYKIFTEFFAPKKLKTD